MGFQLERTRDADGEQREHYHNQADRVNHSLLPFSCTWAFRRLITSCAQPAVIRNSFRRDFPPVTISMADRGTRSERARNSIAASFASPSTGGALTSRQSPPEESRVRRSKRERGLTRSQNVTALPSIVKSLMPHRSPKNGRNFSCAGQMAPKGPGLRQFQQKSPLRIRLFTLDVRRRWPCRFGPLSHPLRWQLRNHGSCPWIARALRLRAV